MIHHRTPKVLPYHVRDILGERKGPETSEEGRGWCVCATGELTGGTVGGKGPESVGWKVVVGVGGTGEVSDK